MSGFADLYAITLYRSRVRTAPIVLVGVLLGSIACARPTPAPTTSIGDDMDVGSTSIGTQAATTSTIRPPTTTSSSAPEDTTSTISAFSRPEWLGTRILPLREDGFGENQPTPEALVGRAFETLDLLDPPGDSIFTAEVSALADAVLARSTWTEDCPVTLDELSYVTLSHWGFDGDVHTGEMIVNASVVDDVIGVFSQLFDAGFPIEQMRVIALDELDAPPTGDFNDTTSFVCRPVVNSTGGWSQHAYGLAVDINPFHNPYEKGDLVLPELASYYLDRSLEEPGMVIAGDIVTSAFAAIGWGWGGNWNTLDDYMHFSQNGR